MNGKHIVGFSPSGNHVIRATVNSVYLNGIAQSFTYTNAELDNSPMTNKAYGPINNLGRYLEGASWGEADGPLHPIPGLESGKAIAINDHNDILGNKEHYLSISSWTPAVAATETTPAVDGFYTEHLVDINYPAVSGGFMEIAPSLTDGGAFVGRIGIGAFPGSGITGVPVLFLPTPELAVDANHDGEIRLARTDGTDQTSTSKPFRFWLNDDNDSGDTGGADIPQEAGHGDGDGQSPRVNGRRDLVDFFPVFLDLKQLLTVLPTSSGFSYKLKHADGALRFVYTNLTRDTAFDYQRPPVGNTLPTSGYGSLDTINPFSLPPENAVALPVTADGVSLNAVFLNYILTNNGGVILVEGIAPTTKPLVLSVEKSDGTVIAEVKLELSIGSVEDMYRRINLRDGAEAPAGLAGDLSVRDQDKGLPSYMGEANGSGPKSYPDSLTNGKWFVFVVGSNVGGQKMRGWQSEVFKRMYWSGSKARFVGVSWYGDPYSDGNDLVYDYHSAARNAFTTAPVLTAKLNALSGSKTIAGHSAACLIISSAIADHGLSVSNACLIDAAMSRESFDGGGADDITGMVPAVWREYPEGYWASHWHELFPSTDARSTLTWRNRFRSAAGVVHNFYSSTEDVLGRFEGTVNGSILENLRAPGSFAWVIQEKAKGNKLNVLGLNLIHAGSDYGGWGFNLTDPLLDARDPKWYFPFTNEVGTPGRRAKAPGEIGSPSIWSDALKRTPFFKTGWGRWDPNHPDQEVIDTNYFDGPSWVYDLYRGTTGNAIAADPVKRSQLLNEAIPALSLAMGSNATSAFEERNYNLPSQYADAAHWPSARGANVGGVPNWHHSDMREVAYLYLYRFYDKLSSLSNQ